MQMAQFCLQGRQLQAEIMDQPGLGVAEHHRALAGLRRLNIASRVAHQYWRAIRAYSRGTTDCLRMLDVASGGGDVAYSLWRMARRRGIRMQVVGLDSSPAACRFASDRCHDAGRDITFEQADVVGADLPTGFDVVTCSLFLHHLTNNQAVGLLKSMASAARLLLASDLRRSLAGYALAHLACRALSRSKVVRFDGPQSVANAFTISEIRHLCLVAGLQKARVRAAWPCRLMIVNEEKQSADG
jgi:2-polyprenyl-3-methyl-5-hydroxy-6-metoxy-1,4-benzoquinol methylase